MRLRLPPFNLNLRLQLASATSPHPRRKIPEPVAPRHIAEGIGFPVLRTQAKAACRVFLVSLAPAPVTAFLTTGHWQPSTGPHPPS